MRLADLIDQAGLPETNVAADAWDSGRRRAGRRKAVLRASVAAALLLIVVSGLSLGNGTEPPRPAGTVDTGPLTDHQFTVAVSIARAEAERLGQPAVSATATVGKGTVYESNTGHICTSGLLLHIKLIGDFHAIPHGSMPGQPYEPTSAVLITADPQSERACLIGVSTGEQRPADGSVLLFAGS